MTQIQFDLFDEELTCIYRDDKYSVKEDGMIYRHRRNGKRRRPLDEEWTYGNPNKQRGYMYISSIPVHRIVATAFHGKQPSEDHVVDHIDTNRRNNRPENLRWVTRIENILLNPITKRRVEIAYGSVENFLKNPSKPLEGKLDPNFDWMRTVTKEEAEESRKNLLEWASKDSIPKGGILDERVFGTHIEIEMPEIDEFTESLTDKAIQKYWTTPTEFPFCPPIIGKDQLNEYQQSLKKDVVFSRNEYSESTVYSAEISEDSESLVVLCNMNGFKDWSLAKVTLGEDKFIHESLGTFFSLEGAQKQFTINLGLEWKGGDSIDDYC